MIEDHFFSGRFAHASRSVSLFQKCTCVPEISSNGALAAIVAVAALAAILYERRRRA
jgi:hypothetical protein